MLHVDESGTTKQIKLNEAEVIDLCSDEESCDNENQKQKEKRKNVHDEKEEEKEKEYCC